MSTTATRKQSQAIRDQMQMIRSDLPYSVDTAREEVAQLADWKYYVRKFPIASMAGAAAIAYIIVPNRKSADSRHAGHNTRFKSAQPSMIEGLVGAVAAMALRGGASVVANHLSKQFLGHATERSTHDNSLTARRSESDPLDSGVLDR